MIYAFSYGLNPSLSPSRPLGFLLSGWRPHNSLIYSISLSPLSILVQTIWSKNYG